MNIVRMACEDFVRVRTFLKIGRGGACCSVCDSALFSLSNAPKRASVPRESSLERRDMIEVKWCQEIVRCEVKEVLYSCSNNRICLVSSPTVVSIKFFSKNWLTTHKSHWKNRFMSAPKGTVASKSVYFVFILASVK